MIHDGEQKTIGISPIIDFRDDIPNDDIKLINCTRKLYGDSYVLELNSQSKMLISTHKKMSHIDQFAIDCTIQFNNTNSKKIQLFTHAESSLQFGIKKIKASYHPFISVQCIPNFGLFDRTKKLSSYEIIGSQRIDLEKSYNMCVIFTGNDIILTVNNSADIRFVLSDVELHPLKFFSEGTSINMSKNMSKFSGYVKKIKIWDTIPPRILKHIEQLEKSGIGEINSKYHLLKNKSILGDLVGNEKIITYGRYQKYKKGAICWSPQTGSHVINKNIFDKYIHLQQFIGFPTKDTTSGKIRGCKISQFERGVIYWTSKTGGRIVHGDILLRYMNGGGESGNLGLPITNSISRTTSKLISAFLEKENPNMTNTKNIKLLNDLLSFDLNKKLPMLKCEFENGILYKNSYGIFSIKKKSEILFNKNRHKLGNIISNDQSIVNKNGNIMGELNRFEHGTIFCIKKNNSSKTYVLTEQINDTYENSGSTNGKLGLPTSNIKKYRNTNISYATFENGFIKKVGNADPEILMNDLALIINSVSSQAINDGLFDSDAELFIKVTLRINNKIVLNAKRCPNRGHYGVSKTSTNGILNCNFKIKNAYDNIKIYIKFIDYDMLSRDDSIGYIEKSFDMMTNWGIDKTHNYNLTKKYSTAKNYNSGNVLFQINSVSTKDSFKDFDMKSAWWSFKNFSTHTLSKQTYHDVFGVGIDTWWSRIDHPMHHIFYNHIFSTSARDGNCFGMCMLAATHMKRNGIIHNMPKSEEIKKLINEQHTYQLTSNALSDALPQHREQHNSNNMNSYLLQIYKMMKFSYMNRDPILLCLTKDAGGHCVLPYKFDDENHKIYVADPNYCAGCEPDCSTDLPDSYVQIHDDTFTYYPVGTARPRKYDRMIYFNHDLFRGNPMAPISLFDIFRGIGLAIVIYFGDKNGKIKFNNPKNNVHRISYSDRSNTVTRTTARTTAVDPNYDSPMMLHNLNCQQQIYMIHDFDKIGFNIENSKNYSSTIILPNSIISINGNTKPDVRDTVSITNVFKSNPILNLQTTANSKSSNIEYHSIKNNSTHIKLNTRIKLMKNTKTEFGLSKRGNSIVYSNLDGKTPISIMKNTGLNTSEFRAEVNPNINKCKIVKITPHAWNIKNIPISAEYLDNPKGSVKRKTSNSVKNKMNKRILHNI